LLSKVHRQAVPRGVKGLETADLTSVTHALTIPCRICAKSFGD